MWALITGGFAGIGRAIAELLKEKGWKLFTISTDSGKWKLEEKTAPETLFDGILQGDLTKIDFSSYDFSSFAFDAVILNAGRWKGEENLKIMVSHYNLVEHLIKNRAVRDGGVFIFIGSISAFTGEEEEPLYSASKGALDGLRRSLTEKYPQFRWIVIHPGAIRTWMFGDPKETPEFIIERCPLKRLGLPEEVASLVWECINNKFINNTSLVIDGGVVG